MANPTNAEQADTSRALHILLVEDESSVREITRRHLAALGHVVRVATDHADALRQLDGSDRCDLVITDIIMPGGSGYGVADAAVARRPGIKVMFVTGYAGTGPAAGQARHPAAPMLHKPFSLRDLDAAVQAALD